ncbi:MAG: hypothetical protein AB7P99_00935 [Vicinamibacterales bacterium]
MTRRHLLASVVAVAVLAPAAAWAHGGHTHNALGTVASIQGDHVEVKTTDGKTITVMLDVKTTVTRGRTKLDATALKVGERVSVDYVQEKTMLMAKAIKLSTAAAK